MAARRRDSRAKDGVPARPRRIERNEDRFENCRALPAPTPGQRAFLFKSRRARGVRHRTPQPAARVRVDGDRHDAHAHAMASPGRLTEVKADPLLTWLERLLGERAPIGIESCLDGRLFARALRELAGEGAHPASTGDALEDLRAGLDRAGLGERCAYMLAALDARDVSGARSLLSVITPTTPRITPAGTRMTPRVRDASPNPPPPPRREANVRTNVRANVARPPRAR